MEEMCVQCIRVGLNFGGPAMQSLGEATAGLCIMYNIRKRVAVVGQVLFEKVVADLGRFERFPWVAT